MDGLCSCWGGIIDGDVLLCVDDVDDDAWLFVGDGSEKS